MIAQQSVRNFVKVFPRRISSTFPPPASRPLLPKLSSPKPRYASGRPPYEPRQRIIYRKFDPEEVRRAKPFVNTENWGRAAKSTRALWFYAVCSGSAVIFYTTHLEKVPVSGRTRFMYFSDASVEEEGERMYQQILQQNRNAILPDRDPRVRQVKRVMRRLIPSTGLEDVDWRIHVIESNEANAFVIPGGRVFVMTGLLPIARDDDGLAAVLGHEIAHNLARHQAEAMSSSVWFILPLRVCFFVGEILFLGQSTGLGRILGDYLLDFGLAKPASRKQESEADYIGLMIMSKSCYNPNGAIGVWQRMQAAGGQNVPEWMSTHPANATRISAMQQWLPKAEEERAQSDCSQMVQATKDFGAAIQRYDPWGAFR